MSSVQCQCGQRLDAAEIFASGAAECPTCGRPVDLTRATTAESVEPAATFSRSLGAAEHSSTVRRMFEALLDPRSIRWMLLIGGGVCVLGLIVWLVSLGVFKDPHVLAACLGVGTMAILGAGWFTALQTRFHLAGQALTFLGCVVAPLNLWFYHAQNLVTVQGHLWVGGLACCLLYASTVVLLRDPIFMYACEVGVTLTSLLLLADMGKITDAPWLSFFLMALGLASIHAERAFSPAAESPFPRRRFGLPLFWSGHAQVGAALAVLLGSQLLGWFVEPASVVYGRLWTGNLLSENHLLAAALWLAGMYVYLYSDIVVRKVGVYLGLACFAMVMAEVTLLWGFNVGAEWIIAAMAATAAGVNLARLRWSRLYQNLDRIVPPLGGSLSMLAVVWAIVLHVRATSNLAVEFNAAYDAGWAFAAAMLITAVSLRMSAFFSRGWDAKSAGVYVFLSATTMLMAVGGALRAMGLIEWTAQAPWIMLAPLGYLIASRIEQTRAEVRALYWVAQTASAAVLLHVLATFRHGLLGIGPVADNAATLSLSLVLAEAAGFYFAAGAVSGFRANTYVGAVAACGAMWQGMGYFGVDPTYFTTVYSLVGVACLAVGRVLGLRPEAAEIPGGGRYITLRGRGASAFQSGNAILTIACLSAFLQGLTRLDGTTTWLGFSALAATAAAALLAAIIAPAENWRRVYGTAIVTLSVVAFLQFNRLIDVTAWQKLELYATLAGVATLAAAHVAMFREDEDVRDSSVSVGFNLGSLLAATPLLIATLYHRWADTGPSLLDEMGLLTVTLAMLVSGLAWKVKATTLAGGGALVVYLIVLVASLAYHPQVEIGVYMAVGGFLVFAAGIGLSVYRDKLLQLPERVAHRQGVFRILNWR